MLENFDYYNFWKNEISCKFWINENFKANFPVKKNFQEILKSCREQLEELKRNCFWQLE